MTLKIYEEDALWAQSALFEARNKLAEAIHRIEGLPLDVYGDDAIRSIRGDLWEALREVELNYKAFKHLREAVGEGQ